MSKLICISLFLFSPQYLWSKNINDFVDMYPTQEYFDKLGTSNALLYYTEKNGKVVLPRYFENPESGVRKEYGSRSPGCVEGFFQVLQNQEYGKFYGKNFTPQLKVRWLHDRNLFIELLKFVDEKADEFKEVKVFPVDADREGNPDLKWNEPKDLTWGKVSNETSPASGEAFGDGFPSKRFAAVITYDHKIFDELKKHRPNSEIRVYRPSFGTEVARLSMRHMPLSKAIRDTQEVLRAKVRQFLTAAIEAKHRCTLRPGSDETVYFSNSWTKTARDFSEPMEFSVETVALLPRKVESCENLFRAEKVKTTQLRMDNDKFGLECSTLSLSCLAEGMNLWPYHSSHKRFKSQKEEDRKKKDQVVANRRNFATCALALNVTDQPYSGGYHEQVNPLSVTKGSDR